MARSAGEASWRKSLFQAEGAEAKYGRSQPWGCNLLSAFHSIVCTCLLIWSRSRRRRTFTRITIAAHRIPPRHSAATIKNTTPNPSIMPPQAFAVRSPVYSLESVGATTRPPEIVFDHVRLFQISWACRAQRQIGRAHV